VGSQQNNMSFRLIIPPRINILSLPINAKAESPKQEQKLDEEGNIHNILYFLQKKLPWHDGTRELKSRVKSELVQSQTV